MSTQTITQIRDIRDEIKESIKEIKAKDYADEKFGKEEEYTAKGIISGIDALLIDISTLTKTPAQFIKTSTYEERASIATILTNIQNSINIPDLQEMAAYIDQLKIMLRRYDVRHTDERLTAFNEHIDDLQKKATEITGQVESIKTLEKTSNEHYSKIEIACENLNKKLEELTEKEEEVETLLEQAESKREEIKELLEKDKERSDDIEELLSTSKSHTEIIDNFSKRVATRESQLENQQVKTEFYEKALQNYKKKQSDILGEAESLIESAKQALEYKTAEGLSAAFIEKYKEAKEDTTTKKWLLGATVCFILAVSLGVWIVSGENLQLEIIIGRISLLPVLLSGVWFCAGQYVKHKNITEDYAYKSVLAKSLVGFSEQLSSESTKGDEYAHYIKSVLAEIHNDPLRKRSSKELSAKEVKDDIKEMLKDMKTEQTLIANIEKIANSR